MAVSYKPSPLGPKTTTPSRPTTSISDPITARARRRQKAKTARFYKAQPWMKDLSRQTRQMDETRRRYWKVESCFYWEALRDTVMAEENRAVNKYFLKPMTTAVTTKPEYKKIVKESMDFKKMEKKWASGEYHGDSYAIMCDFNLIVGNAVAYFPRGTRVHAAAKRLGRLYDEACECKKKWEWMNGAVEIAHEEGLEI